MSNTLAVFAGVGGAVDLCQTDGLDMRPTLLQVLTDLYLQRSTHTPEDERYFTELALRLIDATDVPARAALAARLATYPSAPRAVVERLARDIIEVAAPILTHSCALTPTDLAGIAHDCGSTHADLIAARPMAATRPVQPASSRGQPSLTCGQACELSELFYTAGPAERRLILIHLDYSIFIPAQPLSAMQTSEIRRLEASVLQGRLEAVVRDLALALGISRAQARRAVDDEFGEPLVVAAKALALPPDLLQPMFLIMHPKARLSVDRIHQMAELYNDITVNAARRMAAIWRAAEPTRASWVPQEHVDWRTAADNARRVRPEVSRRSEPPPETRMRTRAER